PCRDKHVAFRSPRGILRHVDQALNLREQFFDRAEPSQPLEPDRRMRCSQQQLLHLTPPPLSRQITEIYRAAKLNRLRIDVELKTSGKLRRTQHSQTIFGKRVFRNCTQDALLEVATTFKWIYQLTGEWILEDSVDGEIATACRFGNAHRRIAFDHEPLVTASRFTFTAWDRDVEMIAQLVDGEGFADNVYWSKLVQHCSHARGVQIVDFEVPVLRFRAHQFVANTATDEQRTTTRVVYGF